MVLTMFFNYAKILVKAQYKTKNTTNYHIDAKCRHGLTK